MVSLILTYYILKLGVPCITWLYYFRANWVSLWLERKVVVFLAIEVDVPVVAAPVTFHGIEVLEHDVDRGRFCEPAF